MSEQILPQQSNTTMTTSSTIISQQQLFLNYIATTMHTPNQEQLRTVLLSVPQSAKMNYLSVWYCVLFGPNMAIMVDSALTNIYLPSSLRVLSL